MNASTKVNEGSLTSSPSGGDIIRVTVATPEVRNAGAVGYPESQQHIAGGAQHQLGELSQAFVDPYALSSALPQESGRANLERVMSLGAQESAKGVNQRIN